MWPTSLPANVEFNKACHTAFDDALEAMADLIQDHIQWREDHEDREEETGGVVGPAVWPSKRPRVKDVAGIMGSLAALTEALDAFYDDALEGDDVFCSISDVIGEVVVQMMDCMDSLTGGDFQSAGEFMERAVEEWDNI
jgi:hypothetical protein